MMKKLYLFFICYIKSYFCETFASKYNTKTNHIYKENGTISFLVIGDWGGLPFYPYKTMIEISIAKQMGIIAENVNSKFLIALGDNFYYDGVKNLNDERFLSTYENVFTSKQLKTSQWYVLAGNHDHNGNVSAQIKYTNVSKNWFFPNYYYSHKHLVPLSKKTIKFLMIDTIVLCGNSDADWKLQQPGAIPNLEEAKKQWVWIENELKSSNDDYLIVAGHYPVFSIAEHGPTTCLNNTLEPLLRKYKVSAYLCGHDHNLQHLQWKNINYFISGASNFIDSSTDHMNSVPKGSLKFHWANTFSMGGFGVVQLDDDFLTWYFLNANGKLLYETRIMPRNIF